MQHFVMVGHVFLRPLALRANSVLLMFPWSPRRDCSMICPFPPRFLLVSITTFLINVLLFDFLMRVVTLVNVNCYPGSAAILMNKNTTVYTEPHDY